MKDTPEDTPETDAEVAAAADEGRGTPRGAVVPLMPAGDLDRLAIEADTDKSSKKHDYMRFYEYAFAPYRDKAFTLLELGVGLPSRRAPSLRTWKAFFPQAQIVGVDIRKVSKDFEEERIAVEIGDASKPRFLKRVAKRWNPSIIIDDASHFWSHQIIGFRTLFPLLPPGGIYVIEDVHTSFRAEEGSQYADHPESFMAFIGRLQMSLSASQRSGPEQALSPEDRTLTAWIDAITVTRRCVTVIKREAVRRRELPPAAGAASAPADDDAE